MKVVICDDDKVFTDNVKKHLDFYKKENGIDLKISIFTDVADVISSQEIYNMAILDVEMPDINGIELGKALRKRNRNIILIYITAHKEYLDEAFNLNAARFFEKPIDSQRFYKGLNDAIERINNTTVNVFLSDRKTSVRISADDIIYIEIQRRGTCIFTIDGSYFSSHKIGYWEEKFVGTLFVKPHKSYIVNLNYITEYGHDYIMLYNKYKVYISRAYKGVFHKSFVKFMEGK